MPASQRQGLSFNTTAIRSAKLPASLLFKTDKITSASRFGTGIIDLGTPRLGTGGWEVQFLTVFSELSIIYEKEFGSIVAEAAFSVAIVAEVFMGSYPLSVQYSNIARLPVGAPGPATNREVVLIGGLNLPQTFFVPAGQQLSIRLYYQIIAAEGPEKPPVYNGLNAVFIPKNTQMQLIMGYEQK